MKAATCIKSTSIATQAKAGSPAIISGLAIVFALALFASPAAHAQTYSVIYNFKGGPLDGIAPQAGVTIRGSVFYGTTEQGGLNCFQGNTCGTVYLLQRAGSDWVEKVIYRFSNSNSGPYFPSGKVAFGPDGHVYGTAPYGGTAGDGVVFELIPPVSPYCATAACFWNLSVLHSFPAENGDGDTPGKNLIFDQQGNIYGISGGGTNALGTVFQMTKLDSAWTEAPIYNFKFAPDGYAPEDGVIMDSNGNLFGTTFFGGTTGGTYGTVYEVSNVPQVGWQEKLLYSFQNTGDGIQPVVGLVMDGAGNLYGATRVGSNEQGPAVFELSPSGDTWTVKVLHEFPPDWEGPYANLTLDAAGNIYGTTLRGGAYKNGNIFKLTNTANGWVYISLHDFTGGNDGGIPLSDVSIDTDGSLYGTAATGGNAGRGVVWRIKP